MVFSSVHLSSHDDASS
ncbi:hypothetical protein TNIN_499401, partial [Trichonephila inaurata madagascariensis]